MLITETADSVHCSEQQGQQLVADWLEVAGLPPDAYPLDTEAAAGVLATAGYVVDAEELQRLGRMGAVPAIGSWDARDLIAAAGALEGRRQWQLSPSPHDGKKHHTRLLLEEFLKDGDAGLKEFASRFKKFDLRFALILLVEADNREVRERLFATVTGLMACRGVDL